MAVSVAKKKLKHATDRNTAKRRIREAYTMQKHSLYQIALDKSLSIALMFIYLPNHVEDSKIIAESVEKILAKIHKKLDATKTE